MSQTFEAFVNLNHVQPEVDAVLARARIIANRTRTVDELPERVERRNDT